MLRGVQDGTSAVDQQVPGPGWVGVFDYRQLGHATLWRPPAVDCPSANLATARQADPWYWVHS
jgi:hypothetical protein